MYEEDEELLEDVIVENKQASEMARIYTDILTGMMDAFTSVISNNLNRVMKLLTSITIILSIPTIVGSFWGMNVKVPFGALQLRLLITIAMAVAISVDLRSGVLEEELLLERRRRPAARRPGRTRRVSSARATAEVGRRGRLAPASRHGKL